MYKTRGFHFLHPRDHGTMIYQQRDPNFHGTGLLHLGGSLNFRGPGHCRLPVLLPSCECMWTWCRKITSASVWHGTPGMIGDDGCFRMLLTTWSTAHRRPCGFVSFNGCRRCLQPIFTMGLTLMLFFCHSTWSCHAKV